MMLFFPNQVAKLCESEELGSCIGCCRARPCFRFFLSLEHMGSGGEPGVETKRRDRRPSIDKANNLMGDANGAAEISAAVGESNEVAAARGEMKKASSIKAMEQQGVAKAEAATNNSSCCVLM